MTDADEFIENFLAHDYDPRKAHEYYIRTRKLVGRKIHDRTKTTTSKVGSVPAFIRRNGEKQNGDLVWTKENRPFRKDKITSKFVPSDQGQAQAREERIAMQKAKIAAAHKDAQKLPEDKRNAVEKKLEELDKKLNKKLDKIRNFKNPFGGAKLKGPKNPFAGAKLSKAEPKPIGSYAPKNPFAGAKLSRTSNTPRVSKSNVRAN